MSRLQKNLIEVTIVKDIARNESVLIPRKLMISLDHQFQTKRIRVCFVMTINKLQGQSLEFLRIDLREDCFFHGKFYVGYFKVSYSSSLMILKTEGITTYLVYKDVLK